MRVPNPDLFLYLSIGTVLLFFHALGIIFLSTHAKHAEKKEFLCCMQIPNIIEKVS